MQVHPAIAALRSDDAPQRQAQTALFAALDAWRATPATSAVIADLARYGHGAGIEQCQVLATLFEQTDKSADFAACFTSAVVRALAGVPFGHVPLRHSTDGVVSTLLLARRGRAAMFLTAINGAELVRQPSPVSVSFAASEAHEVVLAGSAEADLVTCGEGGLDLAPVVLKPGGNLVRDCRREALILRRVYGTLVSLRLQRRAAEPVATREVELASGRLIHQAAATAADSRAELMVALLGRMGRSDAAPALARIARGSGADGLRWQALRECLALDTAAGFVALTVLARTPDDALAAPAGALRAQLVEAYPQLAEAEACPA